MNFRIDNPPSKIVWNNIEVPQDMILFCHGIAKLRKVYLTNKIGKKWLIKSLYRKAVKNLN